MTQTAMIQADVLVRAFVIALVVITPYWLHTRRKLRRRPNVDTGTTDRIEEPSASRLEDVIAGIADAAANTRNGDTVTITVPSDVTVDGSALDDDTVDTLVRDALRRSGLVAVSTTLASDRRTLECRPVNTSDG